MDDFSSSRCVISQSLDLFVLQEARLPKDDNAAIVHLNEIDDEIPPIGLGRAAKPHQIQSSVNPSLKSPLELDLGNDMDDTDLVDDLTVEGELQEPPP